MALICLVLSADSCKDPRKKKKSPKDNTEVEQKPEEEKTEEESFDEEVSEEKEQGNAESPEEIIPTSTADEQTIEDGSNQEKIPVLEESSVADQPIETPISPEQSQDADGEEIPLEEIPVIEEPIIEEVIEEEEQGAIKDIIEYEADSMYFDLEKNKVGLLGNSKVSYGKNNLLAHQVSINWRKNEMLAASKEIDKKVALEDKIALVLEGSEYFAEKIRVNLESQRATVKALFTKIEEGFLRVNRMKRDYDEIFYLDEMSYTTCNLLKPHFGICARKIRLNNMEEEIVSGPVYLSFSEVQTLTFFFGLFYFPNKQHGIIPPRYGGSTDKGIHIKEFGYYWNFNDRLDLSLTADVHSGGTLGINSESYYKKRYSYSGNILYKRSRDISSGSLVNELATDTWKLGWKHQTENNRESSFMADISVENETSRKEESKKSGMSQNSTSQSNLKYTNKLLDIPFYSLGVKASYSKNFTTKETSLVLPSITLQTYNLYPFRGKGLGGTWYNDIYLRHSVEFKNKITTGNDYLSFYKTTDWSDLYKKKKYGVKHSIPLKTNIKIGYFNLIPCIEYRERWYWDSIDHLAGAKNVNGFQRVWDYEPSTELTTTFYGTFIYNQNKAVQAIRHQVKPSLKLVYTPSFRKEYWQDVNGTFKSKFEKHVFDTPSDKEKLILYSSLSNVLEMKLRPASEENEEGKKVPIFEGCDVKGSYDFFAKEFPVGDIEFKARTRLFDNAINIEISRTYDPYSFEEQSDSSYKRIQKFAINRNQGIGHLKKAKLTISTEFKSTQGDKDPFEQFMEDFNRQYAFQHPEEASQNYVNFSIPWTLGFKYDYTYESEFPNKMTKSKVLSSELKLNITEKTVLGLQSGYDFTEEQIVRNITKVSVHRDLHCWVLTFSWLPIAPTQYFEFSVGIKAPILQAIKYTRGEKPYTYV